MNRKVVGQASRLPLGRLAPAFFAGETPAKTAGTAAPLQPCPGSWSQCMRKNEWGFSMSPASPIRIECCRRWLAWLTRLLTDPPQGCAAFNKSALRVGFKVEFCSHAAASVSDLRFQTLKTLAAALANRSGWRRAAWQAIPSRRRAGQPPPGVWRFD